MPPSNPVKFRPADPKEKKIALLAIISFNDTYHVPYSRGKVSEYLEINERTARKWVADSAAAASARPAARSETTEQDVGPRGMKRARSEDNMADLLSSTVKSRSHKSSAAPHQNARRNNGPPAKEEVVAPSPLLFPPKQQLTPPLRKIRQPKTRRQRARTEGSCGLGMQNSDEYVEA